jgi:hypothetical protein
MNHPPPLDVSLPHGFTVVSLNRQGEWNMYDGVLWGPADVAEALTSRKVTDLRHITKPLFWVHLSSEVAQNPGTDTFTNEPDVETVMANLGLRDVKKRKDHWGSYPVLSVTGIRADGLPFHIAWIGLNTPDGWTLAVDYRVPAAGNVTDDNTAGIWRSFLEDTQPRR